LLASHILNAPQHTRPGCSRDHLKLACIMDDPCAHLRIDRTFRIEILAEAVVIGALAHPVAPGCSLSV
jgi:hypothetical protein